MKSLSNHHNTHHTNPPAPSGRSGLGTRMEPGKGIMAPVPGFVSKPWGLDPPKMEAFNGKNGVSRAEAAKHGVFKKEEW